MTYGRGAFHAPYTFGRRKGQWTLLQPIFSERVVRVTNKPPLEYDRKRDKVTLAGIGGRSMGVRKLILVALGGPGRRQCGGRDDPCVLAGV